MTSKDILSGGGSVGGGMDWLTGAIDLTNSLMNTAYNHRESKIQKEREDSAYQRTVADMIKAGLNPSTLTGGTNTSSSGSYDTTTNLTEKRASREATKIAKEQQKDAHENNTKQNELLDAQIQRQKLENTDYMLQIIENEGKSNRKQEQEYNSNEAQKNREGSVEAILSPYLAQTLRELNVGEEIKGMTDAIKNMSPTQIWDEAVKENKQKTERAKAKKESEKEYKEWLRELPKYKKELEKVNAEIQKLSKSPNENRVKLAELYKKRDELKTFINKHGRSGSGGSGRNF